MELYEMESVGRYISHLHRVGASFLSKQYHEHKIGYGQYKYLLQLYMKDGLSHDELTEKMSVDKASTTRAIAKLEQEGYVRLCVNEKDKRKYLIYLTDFAKEKHTEIMTISYEWEQQLTGALNEEEKELLILLMRKMARSNKGYPFRDLEAQMK